MFTPTPLGQRQAKASSSNANRQGGRKTSKGDREVLSTEEQARKVAKMEELVKLFVTFATRYGSPLSLDTTRSDGHGIYYCDHDGKIVACSSSQSKDMQKEPT